MGLFGGKRPEKEAEDLYLSGDYDALLELIFKKAIQGGKMKKDVAISYLKKVVANRESAKAYYLLSLLKIPDKSGLEYAKKAFEMEPTNLEYAENLAMYYSEGMKDEDSAMKVYEEYWRKSGDTSTGIMVAEWYLKRDMKRAGEIAREILKKEPKNRKAEKILKKSENAIKSGEIPCPNCGTLLSKDATVCYACGLDLKRWKEERNGPYRVG